MSRQCRFRTIVIRTAVALFSHRCRIALLAFALLTFALLSLRTVDPFALLAFALLASHWCRSHFCLSHSCRTSIRPHKPPCYNFALSLARYAVEVPLVRRQNAFEHLIRIFRFLVIQFRCGNQQDTISDKRGIHNTRLARHNRCGKLRSIVKVRWNSWSVWTSRLRNSLLLASVV